MRIDGYDYDALQTWEIALRNRAHDGDEIAKSAVREIDKLRRRLADYVTGVM